MNRKYKEPNALTDVAEFHNTFNVPVENKPIIPSKERCALRINLLQEELDELKEAIQDNNIVEIADAFSDIQYVLSGAILEFGMGENFKNLFEEVHRSNMSKVCKTRKEAEATQEHYLSTKGTKSYISKKGDDFLVFRSGDNKVLKSIKYSPANIKSML